MPIGSSDFALKYYSFDDFPGDFAMEHFTIANDEQTLIPLMKDALAQKPDLKIWGSPWCPPQWMKVNQNYASRPMNNMMFAAMRRNLPKTTTAEPSFLAGLNMGSESKRKRLELDNLVVDNECTMDKMMREGQDSFIIEDEYLDAYALYFQKYVQAYREKAMVMSEQQCFNGANSWADFMAAWDLLKENLDNGVEIYDYWNMSLFEGEVSTWGWQQNSLISVDYETRSYKFNYEYYEMKHASHFIKPGAVYLGTSGSHDQALAFQNPDKSIVVLIAQKDGQDENVTITAGKKQITVNVPANSLSTVVM